MAGRLGTSYAWSKNDEPTEAYSSVDDEGDVRDVIVAILEENNFRFSSAAFGDHEKPGVLAGAGDGARERRRNRR